MIASKNRTRIYAGIARLVGTRRPGRWTIQQMSATAIPPAVSTLYAQEAIMDSTRTSRREFLLASVATAMALPSLSASPQSGSGERIIPFSFRASDGDLMDLKRRLDQSRWPERETGVGWEQGPPLDALRDII